MLWKGQMVHSKKVILPALAIAGLLAVGAISAPTVQAMESERGLPLIQRIAERFGLNESEVEEVFTQYRLERHLVQRDHFAAHLAELVEAGHLTQEQADIIVEKYETMQADHEALMQASPEERDTYCNAHHAEVRAWIEKSGIALPEAMSGRSNRGNGAHCGNGIGRSQHGSSS